MMGKPIPQLRTTGVIATMLKVPHHRVIYVLRTRKHIQPAGLAGIYRLYDNVAIAEIRGVLKKIDEQW